MSSEATSAGLNIVPIPEILPIFPLPNVVFFPFTYLPLHIFEPRYREMVEDAASTGECIGMVLLRDGWEDHYDDTPPIFELGCVGRLVCVNPLSDGRYNIVLKGLRRCTYLEQTVDTSYRQAKVNLLSSQEGEELDTTLRGPLMKSAERYLQSQKAQDLCQIITSGKLSDQTLVNSLSAGLDFTPVEKQFLLESENLPQHARRLTDLIRFKLPNLQFPAHG
jgi:Lon protease-like protein